jgi:predicted acyl esterase
VDLPLQDVLHTFQAGHRIMIQVQNSWFPLVDINPQRYVENIYLAEEEDFISAVQRLYTASPHQTRIRVGVLGGGG